jgi:signal transduction histidine kinase
MRRFLPQTLPAWFLLILIAGLAITQVTTLSIVNRERAASNNLLELFRLSDRAFSLVKLLNAVSPAERTQLAARLSNSSFVVTITDTPAIRTAIPADDDLAELEDDIVARLSKFGIVEARIRRESADTSPAEPPNFTPDPDVGQIEHEFLRLAASISQSARLLASIEFKDGQWLNFVMPLTPVSPLLTGRTLALMALVAGFVVILSISALRRLTAPYRLLESAVKRLGEDLKSSPLPEGGSHEYRSAARAVNAMQARLRDYVEDREQLAAALAHDLRTPLTRMKLRLELLTNRKIKASLLHDVSDIEAISRSVVDFATFEVKEEADERIDMHSLVDSIVDAYREVSFDEEAFPSRGLVCVGRPIALRRCITNLIDNAVTYGGKAHVGLERDGDDIVLMIRDEGPGIPQAKLDTVFRPFTRVEGSRSRETGGFGLGLTIARTIARSFGGDIRLANRPGGGLMTELRLPRAESPEPVKPEALLARNA